MKADGRRIGKMARENIATPMEAITLAISRTEKEMVRVLSSTAKINL